MNIKQNTESIVDTIAIPLTVNEKQAQLARLYVKANIEGTLTVQEFCKQNSISTKTWYTWLENDDFQWYLNEVQNIVIPDDERIAYQKIKKHILKLADKKSITLKEIELFTETFSYVVEADRIARMKELGIDNSNKPLTEQTIEDRKAVLLQRLKTNNKKEN